MPTYATSNPSPVFSIQNTQQYYQLHALFTSGIKSLQNLQPFIESGGPWSYSNMSALTQALLNISKALTTFLGNTLALSSAPRSFIRSRYQQQETAWLRPTIANLRIECHRYSWVVLDISRAMKRDKDRSKRLQKILTAGSWRSQDTNARTADAVDTGDDDSSVDRWSDPTLAATRSNSPTPYTSGRSLESQSRAASPTSSVSTLDHGFDNYPNGSGEDWQFVGYGVVHEGVVYTSESPDVYSEHGEDSQS